MIEAPDLYEEINFDQRCKEYKLQKVEKSKFRQMRNGFQRDQIREYIDPYIELVTRNEKDISEEIKRLVGKHLDKISEDERSKKDLQTEAVRKLYEKAIDLNNPKRDEIKLEKDMYGRISNNVCSYDFMNN